MNFSTSECIKKYPIAKIDTHTHTYFSFDCAEHGNSPDKMCAAAIKAGLDAIVLTDHVEVNSEAEGIYTPFYYAERQRQCEAARQKYKDSLDVYIGIELGQAIHYPELAEKIIKDGAFDYVIGSVHNTRGDQDFYYMDFSKVGYDEVIRLIGKYFDEYYEMTRLPYVDQCAHLTYPLRYLRQAGLDADILRWEDKIIKILKSVIDGGKVLELNTNCLRHGIELPDDLVLEMYRSYGGELVRIGSDAHYECDTAADFDRAKQTIDKVYGGKIQ